MAEQKKKIVQVRLPVPLAADASLVAQSLDPPISTTAFVELCVREGIERHMSALQKRVEKMSRPRGKKQPGEPAD